MARDGFPGVWKAIAQHGHCAIEVEGFLLSAEHIHSCRLNKSMDCKHFFFAQAINKRRLEELFLSAQEANGISSRLKF